MPSDNFSDWQVAFTVEVVSLIVTLLVIAPIVDFLVRRRERISERREALSALHYLDRRISAQLATRTFSSISHYQRISDFIFGQYIYQVGFEHYLDEKRRSEDQNGKNIESKSDGNEWWFSLSDDEKVEYLLLIDRNDAYRNKTIEIARKSSLSSRNVIGEIINSVDEIELYARRIESGSHFLFRPSNFAMRESIVNIYESMFEVIEKHRFAIRQLDNLIFEINSDNARPSEIYRRSLDPEVVREIERSLMDTLSAIESVRSNYSRATRGLLHAVLNPIIGVTYRMFSRLSAPREVDLSGRPAPQPGLSGGNQFAATGLLSMDERRWLAFRSRLVERISE